MQPSSRLLLLLASVVLAACQPRPQAGDPLFDGQSVADPAGIQIAVASDDFAAGQPRIPIVLYQGAQRVADVQSVSLAAFDLSTDPPTPGWTGPATSYTDYEVPYWVIFPELPHAGFWGLGAVITLADGSTTPAEFVVEVLERSNAPSLGSQPPASQNRTLASEPDIFKLTSGQDPIPDLYQMTIEAALESGQPSVITFATPRFCTSKICAPVVGSVEAVYAELGQQANFIHIEVFKDFETLEYADEMAEWGLTSEPWTFVLDDEGTLVAKLGGPVSPRELTATLLVFLP